MPRRQLGDDSFEVASLTSRGGFPFFEEALPKLRVHLVCAVFELVQQRLVCVPREEHCFDLLLSTDKDGASVVAHLAQKGRESAPNFAAT